MEQTPNLIKKDPYLIIKVPYTVAINQEILRLYPPASSVRKGQPGRFLPQDGKQRLTEGMRQKKIHPSYQALVYWRCCSLIVQAGFMVWPVSYALHHFPDLWPSPDAFIPER